MSSKAEFPKFLAEHHDPAWLHRLLLSFVAFLAGSTIVGVVFGIASLREPNVQSLREFFSSVRAFTFYTALIGVTGWLLSIPVLVSLRGPVHSRRFLLYLVIGTALGPAAIVIFFLYATWPKPTLDIKQPFLVAFASLGVAVAFITTLIYLVLLHRAQQKARIRIPNDITLAAIREAEAGNLQHASSIKEFMRQLKAED